jgi:hypothetical protein
MSGAINESDLEASLDEALSPEEMARMEARIRKDEKLARRLSAINSRRDRGVHSLGEIWRRHRLSCPTRDELGSYLLGALSQPAYDYVVFHLDTISCRYCQANLADLENQQAEQPSHAETRRRKYFQSSAGYLRKKR